MGNPTEHRSRPHDGTILLDATGVEKRFPLSHTLRDLFYRQSPGRDEPGGHDRVKHEHVLALSGASIRVREGEAVAIVGRNGAGKSTLLRILGGISTPSLGQVYRTERVACLLDLGSGLIDHLTGAQNISSALALSGRSSSELTAVANFSGLGAALNRLVGSYSTGMRLRLAYALAIGSRPKLLIADEIIAVGDEAFQRRCALHLQEFLLRGGGLVLATHNLYVAERICSRAIWLDSGRVCAAGPTREVVVSYRRRHQMETSEGEVGRPGRVLPRPLGSGGPSLVVTGEGAETGDVVTGRPWRISLGAELASRRKAAETIIQIRASRGELVARIPAPGKDLAFGACRLLPGWYTIEVFLEGEREDPSIRQEFAVAGTCRDLGTVLLEHRWS